MSTVLTLVLLGIGIVAFIGVEAVMLSRWSKRPFDHDIDP